MFAERCQRVCYDKLNLFASDKITSQLCKLGSGDFVRQLESFGLGGFQITIGPPILTDVLDVGHVRTIIL